MKKALGITLLLAFFQSSLSFACDYTDVVLIDKEECEFLGKVIGTEYSCVDIKNTTFKLYNRGKEENSIEIKKDDKRYQIIPKEQFFVKTAR